MENNSITKLSIFHSIIKMLITAMSFFLGVYYNSIGFSGFEIGIVFAIGIIASIVTILPSGISNDRFKSKSLIGIALILIGLFYLGISQTQSFLIIAFLALLEGIGKTVYTASSDSLFYKSTNKENIPQRIGIFQGLTYFMTGLGMIIAGTLLDKALPFAKIFLIIAILFFTMTIISQIALPKTKTHKFELLSYKKDIFQPKILFFLLIMFIFALHFGAESTTYGLFLKKTFGLSPFQMGLYVGIAIMIMALAVYVISKKVKNWRIEYVLVFGLFLSGSCHILMSINKPILSAFFRILHEIGDAATFFFILHGIAQLFDLKRVGGNAGIFTFTATIGSATGALIFGPMGESLGYHVPLIVSGVTTLLALALTLQFLHHFAHNNEHSTNRITR